MALERVPSYVAHGFRFKPLGTSYKSRDPLQQTLIASEKIYSPRVIVVFDSRIGSMDARNGRLGLLVMAVWVSVSALRAQSSKFDELVQPSWATDHVIYDGELLKLKLDSSSGWGSIFFCFFSLHYCGTGAEASGGCSDLFCMVSGSGFASKSKYLFGKVTAELKLVEGDSAGTVTAFYVLPPISIARN